MEIRTRPAQASDGDDILTLMPRLAAFDVPESRNAEHLWMHDAALLRRWLAGDANECLVHVALDADGAIAGMAMATLRPELLSHEPSAHLEAIAVAAGSEGTGVGKMLLEAVERDARSRGALSMSLHVFAANGRARAFYEKHGYDGELMRYIKPLRVRSD
jgi:ribosomal protein S18 acetylase RimI-like enzyme